MSNSTIRHKFGYYELWGEPNQHFRCSLSTWTNGNVMASYRGAHRLYNTSGKLLQVLTFEDFGFGSNEHIIVTTHVTQWDEILCFTQIHQTQFQVFVFKHALTKVELQRKFVIEITDRADSIRCIFTFPNGSICVVFDNSKTYVYN